MKRTKKILIGTLIALGIIYVILIVVAYLPYETTPIEQLTGKESRFVEVNGHTVHYTKQGTGKPLILVHGFAGFTYTWRYLIPLLTDHFTVYAYDVLGFGLSDKPPDAINLGDETYTFCGVKCITEFVLPKLTQRICAKDGCNRKVPKDNRLLCKQCYRQGENIGEQDVTIFHTEHRENWEEEERTILEGIREKVRVFSSRDMTQEELRELVPSLRDKEE